MGQPQKNARKRFMIFFSIIGSWEQHIKSWTKLGHHKGPTCDVKKRWQPLLKNG